jgi:hypothetical protein
VTDNEAYQESVGHEGLDHLYQIAAELEIWAAALDRPDDRDRLKRYAVSVRASTDLICQDWT